MRDMYEIRGAYRLELVDKESGRVIWKKSVKNQLTAPNVTDRLDNLMGVLSRPNLDIAYFAFGDGTTTATVNDTQLVNELFRKQVTAKTRGNNYVQSVVSLGGNEANFTIREIGVFCGPAATEAANTGTLLSRVNVNIEKNENLVLNITRMDTVQI